MGFYYMNWTNDNALILDLYISITGAFNVISFLGTDHGIAIYL